MTCHYCRDAATTTAGGRYVCDDCREAYERQIANVVRSLLDETADEIACAVRLLLDEVEVAK
jgi:transposase-like protein